MVQSGIKLSEDKESVQKLSAAFIFECLKILLQNESTSWSVEIRLDPDPP